MCADRSNQREVVAITGASAGVGRATARIFARHGARIGLIARGLERLEATCREVKSYGGEALVCPADVSDADAVESAAASIENRFGPIDIWINNAMTSVFSPFREMTAAEFHRVTGVCYLGFVHGTMSALRRMLARNRGTVVQVGSALSYRSIPLQSAYCGAKHAIVGFTDSIRSELIRDRREVHLTVVHMPALNTPQFGWVKSRLPNKAQPVPPIFQPEVAAEAIYYAAYARRREIWVGGPTVMAILGQKIAPGFLDEYLARHAYEKQQTSEPRPENQPVNLWEPAPGDAGAHGAFDERAKWFSLQQWCNQRRAALGLAAAVLAGFFAGRHGFS